jgi:hypothetical protein
MRRRLPSLPLTGLALLIAGTARADMVNTVFVIDMENHNLTQPNGTPGAQQLFGNTAAPFLNTLMGVSTAGYSNAAANAAAAQSSWASNYYNVGYNQGLHIHPSEPNYIWQEAGSNFGVNTDADPYTVTGGSTNVQRVNNASSLSALLQAKYGTKGWKSYQEDMELTGLSVPTTSVSGTSAGYTNPYNGSHQYNFAVKHDGQPFFPSTNGGTLAGPGPADSTNPEAAHYAPLTQLGSDLTNNTLAKYNLITPNQYNDMHSSLNTSFSYNGVNYTAGTDQQAIAIGDNFLSIIVPQIMASQAYRNNGAIVIWFDETENGDTTQFTIPEIVISPLAKGNSYQSTLAYTHSSDLKTLQNLFGVAAPGGGYLGDANTAGTNDLSDLFVAGAVPNALPTPVPPTFVLFGLGAACIAGWGWRRKRQAANAVRALLAL